VVEAFVATALFSSYDRALIVNADGNKQRSTISRATQGGTQKIHLLHDRKGRELIV